jgi:hypothetical protein
MDQRPLTFGEMAVGVSFNPSGDKLVYEIKMQFAAAIDEMHALSLRSESPEVKRMCSIAITNAQTAQMWAVKAATWQK